MTDRKHLPEWAKMIELGVNSATPGPWESTSKRGLRSKYIQNGLILADGDNTLHLKVSDSSLIEWAPTNLTALLDALDLAMEALQFQAKTTGECADVIKRIKEIGSKE